MPRLSKMDVPRVSVGLRKVALNPKETRTQVRPRWYQKEAKWTCRDLNSGPLPCQGSDLPTDLHAQMGAFAARPAALHR